MSRESELADCEPLVWKDRDSGSYERAQNAGVIVRQRTRFTFVISLTDGDNGHLVTMARDWHGYVGYCGCDGWKYHDGPCAHLWGLRQANRHGVADIEHVNGVFDPSKPARVCPKCGTDVSHHED